MNENNSEKSTDVDIPGNHLVQRNEIVILDRNFHSRTARVIKK